MNQLFNENAEKSVLGSMFLSKSAFDKTKESLSVEHFHINSHKIIFQAMIFLDQTKQPVDLTTLMHELQRSESLDKIGGISYVSSVISYVPMSANIDSYILIVRDLAMLRSLVEAATNIVTTAHENLSTDEIIEFAEKSIFEVVKNKNVSAFKSISSVVSRNMEIIEELSVNKKDITGLDTGYIDYNKMTHGLNKNDLFILAARPAMGKTAFALNLAQNVAALQDATVAIFSLEMGAEQLVMRMLSSIGNIEMSKLQTGALNSTDWTNLTRAVNQLSKSKIYVDDTPGIKINEIRAKCRRLKASTSGLDFVLIDYLQLIEGSGRYAGNRQQEVSEISRALKTMALELKIPIIALSQLSRDVEKREDKRPLMSDLRESGSIEQDADIVGFLYRADYYSKEAQDQNKPSEVELILGKHRNGPTGTIKLLFNKKYSKFLNITNFNEEGN